MKDKSVILLVDDNIQNIEFIETHLAPIEYEIVKATTGEEALKKLFVNQIDLILLALTTSGMDGFELIRRIRQNNAYQLLPIILVTTSRKTKDLAKWIKAGCDDFICKPVTRLVLLARIRSTLKAKAYHGSMYNYVKVLEADKKYIDDARQYAEEIINTIHEPLIFMDQELRVISANRSFYEVFRENPKNIVGELIYNLGNKQWDLPKLRELLETILQQTTTFHNYEVEYDFADIGKRTMLLNARQIKRDQGKQRIILLAIEDITERKQLEENIQMMAFHDSLTGLPNRKLFSDRLGVALSHAKRNKKKIGVVMLDLDKFKNINDTLGHDTGDILLKAAGERLSKILRKGDTVARFGGNEFVLILFDLKAIEDAIQVLGKIVDRFNRPFLIDTHQLVVTTSIGIALYPVDGIDEGTLLKNADKAMYQAKKTGRARYLFYNKGMNMPY